MCDYRTQLGAHKVDVHAELSSSHSAHLISDQTQQDSVIWQFLGAQKKGVRPTELNSFESGISQSSHNRYCVRLGQERDLNVNCGA